MSRRLSALLTIAKIQKQDLDERALELAGLQSQRAQLETARNDIAQKRIEGSSVTMHEALPYLTRFLEATRAQEDDIAKSTQELDHKIASKKDAVLEVWRDSKTSDYLMEDIRSRLKSDHEKREQAEIDERSIIAHSRSAVSET